MTSVESVRKWGGSTTDAILDPSCQIFRVPAIDGLIGYRDINGCAVVFGDPLCPSDKIENLIDSFHEYCESINLKVIYLIISEPFAAWLVEKGFCKSRIEYGEELILNPHDDPRKRQGSHASLVRRKVRHAESENVIVKEYIPTNATIEKGIVQVGEKWLENRQGPQIHISNVRTFDNTYGKRWFYAEVQDQIVGVLTLNRLEKHDGYLLNHLMFTPDAPGGVPEILVITALNALVLENCNFVTFGSVPAASLGEIVGLGPFSKYFAVNIYLLANKMYQLDGKKKFWEKFAPSSDKMFLAFQNSHIGLKELIALKNALNATLA